jgi:hypothetical protein
MTYLLVATSERRVETKRAKLDHGQHTATMLKHFKVFPAPIVNIYHKYSRTIRIYSEVRDEMFKELNK